jgi:plasmid stabilization system protein ParE
LSQQALSLAITPRAVNDLEAIWEYIALKQANPQAAGKLIEDIRAACLKHLTFPYSSPLLPWRAGIRYFPYKNYVIFYRVHGSAFEVLRVLHGSRDYGGML